MSKIIRIFTYSVIADIGPKFLRERIYSRRIQKLANDLRYPVRQLIGYGIELEKLSAFIARFISDNPIYKFHIASPYSTPSIARIFPVTDIGSKIHVAIKASHDFEIIQIEMEYYNDFIERLTQEAASNENRGGENESR